MQSNSQKIDELLGLFKKHGTSDYFGEKVSQEEHACQSAELARSQGYDDEVIIAALLHDIGHLCAKEQGAEPLGDVGFVNHEKIGADYLRSLGFSERIAKLVEGHVNAKRYLTFASPDYYNQLSDASKETLNYQGGMMNEAEAKQFHKDPLFDLSIQMRYWDEEAKVPGQAGHGVDFYRPMLLYYIGVDA